MEAILLCDGRCVPPAVPHRSWFVPTWDWSPASAVLGSHVTGAALGTQQAPSQKAFKLRSAAGGTGRLSKTGHPQRGGWGRRSPWGRQSCCTKL